MEKTKKLSLEQSFAPHRNRATFIGITQIRVTRISHGTSDRSANDGARSYQWQISERVGWVITASHPHIIGGVGGATRATRPERQRRFLTRLNSFYYPDCSYKLTLLAQISYTGFCKSAVFLGIPARRYIYIYTRVLRYILSDGPETRPTIWRELYSSGMHSIYVAR